MKLSKIIDKLRELTDDFECHIDRDFEVNSILPPDIATPDSITYIELEKYEQYLPCKAGAVIARTNNNIQENAIVARSPALIMAYASSFFESPLFKRDYNYAADHSGVRIMPNVFIGENVSIGSGTTIMPSSVICDNVKIGSNCFIMPNVTIYSNTIIGNNVRIHSGTAIGSDGYGYAHTRDGEHIKIIHNGGVIIEDDVEIGVNTAIDRAVFKYTIIRKGTKIDNQVQIAHNCIIGENSLIVGQVGIAGSTKIGKHVMVGGKTGILGHLEVGDYAQVAALSGVTKNLMPGKKYRGAPASEIKEYEHSQLVLRKLIRQHGRR